MESTCAKCGVDLPSAATFYDENANVVCEKCMLAGQEALTGRIAPTGTLQAAGYGALGLGIVAFYFNPFWLLSLVALAGGIYVFKSLGDTNQAARLSRPGEKLKKAAIVGMALAGMAAVVQLLRMMGKLGE